MQDTFHVEDELLLQHHEDVGVIHHVGNKDQHTDIGSNFGGMQGFGSGAEVWKLAEMSAIFIIVEVMHEVQK
jgi:hypothetical protein